MIAIPKQQYKVEFIFPIVILGLSIWSLEARFPPASVLQYLAVAVSVIGVLGAIFYFINNKYYALLIFIWSFAQLVVIKYTTVDPESGYKIEKSILDLGQGIKIDFGFTLGIAQKSIYIGVNFVGIIFLGLAKILSLSLLYGKEISINSYGEGTALDDILPTRGIIEKRVTLSKEKNWLLTKLQPKEGHESSTQYALIKPKDNSRLKLNKRQIVHFLLVPDVDVIKDGNNDRNDFYVGNWAVVE